MSSRPTVAVPAIHANLKENDLLISKTLKPLDRPLKPSLLMVAESIQRNAGSDMHTQTSVQRKLN